VSAYARSVRAFVSCLLFAAACGGSTSSSSGGTLSVSGSGTISAGSSVNASVSETIPLTDHRAPSTLSFTLAGGGRVVTAEANAVVAALHGERLDALTGNELSVNEVLTGSGALSGSVSPQNLPFAYVVQSYDPTQSPFLVLAASASAAGTSVYATVSFESGP